MTTQARMFASNTQRKAPAVKADNNKWPVKIK